MSRCTVQDAEYKEWKHVVQEIARFLRADSPFMNMRPLRYSYAFDPPPDTLRTVPPTVKKRGLVLSDTILCSYYPNEVMLPYIYLCLCFIFFLGVVGNNFTVVHPGQIYRPLHRCIQNGSVPRMGTMRFICAKQWLQRP